MGLMIKAEKIIKEFGETKEERTCVLQGIDLEVHQGEFVVIMGQSGSGKSTLLYSISGMDKMSSGKVIFDGEDISNLKEEKMSQLRLEKMGFIFQHSYLLKNLTIQDNIVLPAMKARKMKKLEIIEQANGLMKKMEIDHVAKHDTNQVSGGQLQRAAICRALINHPRILFADEPTGALNRSTTKEVMDILNGINQEGTTIVLVTHDAKVAARADRVIYLADGQIEAECKLEKYKKTKEKERENVVNTWLVQRGF